METMLTDERKSRIAAMFDRVSNTYDAPVRPWFDHHAAALVRAVTIPEGASVLDVATGTGKVALAAARTVGARGRVVGIDLSLGMLARALGKAAGLPVEFRQMDAEALEFPDEAFDVVLCGFGVFFPPDVPRGVREMRRVLKPGGRVAVTTWARGSFEPAATIAEACMKRHGVPAAEGRMNLGEPAPLQDLLEAGGFREVRIARESIGYVTEPDDYWTALVMGASTQERLSRFSPDAVERLHGDVVEALGRLRTDRGIWIDTSALIGTGVRR